MTPSANAELKQWLAELLELIERSRDEYDNAQGWRTALRDDEEEASHRVRLVIDDEIWERVAVFGRIANRVAPGVADRFDTTRNANLWPWFDLEPKVRMVLGIVRQQDRIDALLGPRGPVLAVSGMHPEFAGTAARLFEQGHYREAVLRAARTVNEMTQDKLEVRGVEGVSLVQQAWSTNDPHPGQPRLRAPGVDRAAEERLWKDLHEGAILFGKGIFMRIRNVVEHGREEPGQAVAAEYLAALSCYGRWIEAAEVIHVD